MSLGPTPRSSHSNPLRISSRVASPSASGQHLDLSVHAAFLRRQRGAEVLRVGDGVAQVQALVVPVAVDPDREHVEVARRLVDDRRGGPAQADRDRIAPAVPVPRHQHELQRRLGTGRRKLHGQAALPLAARGRGDPGVNREITINEQPHLRRRVALGRAHGVGHGQLARGCRRALLRLDDRDRRRQDVEHRRRRRRGPRRRAGLRDRRVHVQLLEHAVDHVGAVEAVAEARGGVELGRLVPAPVHLPADQVLRPGRGVVVALRRPQHPALPVRVRVEGQQLRRRRSSRCQRMVPSP